MDILFVFTFNFFQTPQKKIWTPFEKKISDPPNVNLGQTGHQPGFSGLVPPLPQGYVWTVEKFFGGQPQVFEILEKKGFVYKFDDIKMIIVIVYWTCSILLIGIAGLFSGLTLGMLSQDVLDLEILSKAGESERQRRDATNMLWIIKHYYHRLMVTLIMGNMIAAEALPIFMDQIVPSWGAVILSVTAIMIFGEIVPQSICGRYGLRIGAFVRYPIILLMFIFTPINYPIGKILDWILGDKTKYYTSEQLKVMMRLHESVGIDIPIEMHDF